MQLASRQSDVGQVTMAHLPKHQPGDVVSEVGQDAEKVVDDQVVGEDMTAHVEMKSRVLWTPSGEEKVELRVPTW